MKLNKYLIYTIAIIFSFAFISCNDDVEKNGNGNENDVRKLPSKITIRSTYVGCIWNSGVITFNYDNQNRLTKIVFDENERQIIEYDANGRISRAINIWDGGISYRNFEYIGNTIIITNSWDNSSTELLTLNADGQLTSIEWNRQDSWLRERAVTTLNYTAGNLIRMDTNGHKEDLHWGEIFSREEQFDYTYSEYLNIFRNAASPNWLKMMFLQEFGLFLFTPSRNMPSKTTLVGNGWNNEFAFTHEADADGYVTSSIVTISWVGSDWDNYENRTTRNLSKRESGVSLRSNFFGNFQSNLRSATSTNSETAIITYEYILAQ